MSTLHIIFKMNRHAKQLCHLIQKHKAFVYNEVILVKIWNHHIYLWNYTQYLLVHQQFSFSDERDRVLEVLLAANFESSPTGTIGRPQNSSSLIPWRNKKCMAPLSTHRKIRSSSDNIGTTALKAMALGRHATVATAPLVLPHNSNWPTPTPVVLNNPACACFSPYVPTRVSSA